MSTKTVRIEDLKTNLFVRTTLDQDHALYLAGLIEGGVKLPPIQITEDNMVIDGRHRIEAYQLNDYIEVRCEVVDVADELDLIKRAYRANTGGSKPPTPQDTEHTIMLLLDRGMAQKDIAPHIGLPMSMARTYITQVKSKMNRAKLLKASKSVTDDGLTVAKAAEKHEVDVDKLKELLSGRRNKHKPGVAETQRTLTFRYKSLGLSNANTLKRLIEKYEDGDVPERQVNAIFDHLKSLQKQSERAVADWRKRFEGMERK